MKCKKVHLCVAIFVTSQLCHFAATLCIKPHKTSKPDVAIKDDEVGPFDLDIREKGASTRAPPTTSMRFPDEDPSADTCCTKSSQCTEISKCGLSESVAMQQNICGFEGTMPMICCPMASQETTPSPKTTTTGKQIINPGEQKAPFNEDSCFKAPTDLELFARSHLTEPDAKKQFTWPFMVSIYENMTTKLEFLCAGTLISRTKVLTSAYCFLHRWLSKLSDNSYVLRLGDLTLITNATLDRSWPHQYASVEVNVHPEYRYPKMDNDIAIVSINGPAQFDATAQPACFFGQGELSSKASLIGWRQKDPETNVSHELKDAEMFIMDRDQCANQLLEIEGYKDRLPDGITERMICAGNNNKPKDACQGDDGSPLVIQDEDAVWRLAGVTSGGTLCGREKLPVVYARVDRYIDWIESI